MSTPASATPAAGRVPIARGNGTLDPLWLTGGSASPPDILAALSQGWELAVASTSSPTELNALGATAGEWKLVRSNVAGNDDATWYRLDTTSAATNMPATVASLTAGLKWVAVWGRYQATAHDVYGALTAKGGITVQDPTDNTKQATFDQTAQTTATTLTLKVPAIAASRILNFPLITGTDTLASLGLAQTFTALTTHTGGVTLTTVGLTLTDVNVALSATTGTKFGTATTQKLAFFNATPVAQQTGDVATALTTFGLVTSPTVRATDALDGTFQVKNTADTTKQLGFSLGGLTTGKVVTLAPVNAVSGTLTIPSFGAADTLATLGQTSQTFTGINIFSGSTNATNTQSGVIVQNSGSNATSVGIGQGNIWAGGNVICGGKMSVGIAGTSQTLSINSAGNVIFELQQAGTTIGYLANGSAIFGGANVLDFAFNCNTAAKKVILGNAGVRGLEVVDGTVNFPGTTDATALGTAGVTAQGGVSIAKNLIHAKGRGAGVTSTATAAGTTTLTSTSTEIQTFTGVTTQTVQFPAANLFGAGIAVLYVINNQSTGAVTPTRAGADTFQGGGTTDTVAAGACKIYASDGVSKWLIISAS